MTTLKAAVSDHCYKKVLYSKTELKFPKIYIVNSFSFNIKYISNINQNKASTCNISFVTIPNIQIYNYPSALPYKVFVVVTDLSVCSYNVLFQFCSKSASVGIAQNGLTLPVQFHQQMKHSNCKE